MIDDTVINIVVLVWSLAVIGDIVMCVVVVVLNTFGYRHCGMGCDQ